jgi:hypothetical protein
MNSGEASLATVATTGSPAPNLTVVGAPPAHEELELELQQKQQQLLLLRRQQEELERQRSDLEDLRRKQDDYVRGKAEMIEHLTRGLVVLERQQTEAQRLAELCLNTRRAFGEHLERLQNIRDDEWAATNLRSELAQALGTIENARVEYTRACTKLDALQPAATDTPLPGAEQGSEFSRYVRLGFAASLPLIVAGTVWLVVVLLTRKP